jgi:hypothetical protein
MRKRCMFLALCLLFVVFSLVGVASALTPISNCQELNVPGEIYRLTGDIIDNTLTKPCLNVTAANIEIDCQNFKIQSNREQTGIHSNQDGLIVRDCTIDMNSGSGQTGFGIKLVGSRNSQILDSSVEMNDYGIFIDSASTGTTIDNLISNNNEYGIYTWAGITLSNSVFTDNYDFDIYFNDAITAMECGLTTFSNVIGTGGSPIGFYETGLIVEQDYSELILCDYQGDNTDVQNIKVGSGLDNERNNGILVIKSSSVRFLNVNSSNNEMAIEIHGSSNIDLDGFFGDNNDFYGVYLDDSSGVDISNSFLRENDYYDYYMNVNSESYCVNSILNTIGSGSRPIEYYGLGTGTISNRLVSEMILCNADNVVLNNVNVSGSQTKQNNAFLLFRTDNGNLNNIDSIGNYRGIYSRRSNTNNITNSDTHNNLYGVYLSIASNGNTLGSVFSHNNTWDGFRFYTSDGTVVTNSGADENRYGLYIYNSESASISNSMFRENLYYDSWVIPSNDAECTHTYSNVGGSGGRPIEFYGYNSEGDFGRLLSEMIVCDADGAQFFNIEVFGSDFIDNNVVEVARTNGAQFTNLNSTGNRYGVYNGYTSIGNNYFDVKLNENGLYGAYIVSGSDGNTFTKSSFNDNQDGLRLDNTNNNLIEDSEFIGNLDGISIYTNSQNNNINNNSISGNADGVYFSNAGSNFMTNNSILSNTFDGVRVSGGTSYHIDNNTLCYNNNFDANCSNAGDSSFLLNTCDVITPECGTCALSCPIACTDDSECQNGNYCDGSEQCISGSCVSGSPVDCSDGASCSTEWCNETIQACEYFYNDSECGSGEVCSSGGCTPGGFCELYPAGYGPMEYPGCGSTCGVTYCGDYNLMDPNHQGYEDDNNEPINREACQTDCNEAYLNDRALAGVTEGFCSWDVALSECYFDYFGCRLEYSFSECFSDGSGRNVTYWWENSSGQIDLINCGAPCQNHVGGVCEKVEACPNTILLSFFSLVNFFSVIVIVAFIYFLSIIEKENE